MAGHKEVLGLWVAQTEGAKFWLQKPGGTPPKPPAPPGVQATDQINLTDEESRIMPVSGGGFEQAYNAQAAVDACSLLVVAAAVTQAQRQGAGRTHA